MFIGELVRADRQHEPGGGRFLRAGFHEPAPGGRRAMMFNLFERPSLAAGFFMVPSTVPNRSANCWRRLLNLIQARLWLAFLPAACAWLTACSRNGPQNSDQQIS